MLFNRQPLFTRDHRMRTASTIWLFAVLCGMQAGAASVRIPVRTAAEPPVPVNTVSSFLTGASGTVLAGNTERALEPGRYRLHAELALTPLGDTQTTIRHYLIEAGGAQRVLNSLHFREDAHFENFTLDVDIRERQTVPVGIRWQMRPGHETRKAENADALQAAPLAPPTPDDALPASPDPFAAELAGEKQGRFSARSCRIEVLSPVMMRVTTDKIVYRPGEQGKGLVDLENLAGTAEAADLKILLAHGLDDRRILHTESFAIPARSQVARTVTFDTADLAWGCELLVQVTTGRHPVHEASSVFCVASNIWEVAAIAGNGPDYGFAWKDPERAALQVEKWRQSGFTGFELYFWPPCGFSDFTPDHEDFVSGQMQYQHSISGTRNLIAAARARGLSASLYSNLWCVDGYPGYELMRRHPEWMISDFFDPSAMEMWRLAEQGKIPAPRSWYRAEITKDPETSKGALEHHAAEILATHEQFGWNAIRYDTYLSSPWTIMATRLVRERVGRKAPSFQFGYNSFPLADESIGALEGMVSGGGMTMLEYIRFEQYASLAAILDELLAVREAVWRRGGHIGPLYRPPEAGTSAAADEVWLSSILLASGGHPYYAPLENDVGGHPRFALRYSEFLWNNRMRPLEDADKRIAFGNGFNPLRWQKLVRILDRGAQRRRLVVHILNADGNLKHFNNLTAIAPPLRRDVSVTIRLPDSATIEGAWHLAAVPVAHHEPLPLTRKDGGVQAVIPEVRFWSVLLLDYRESGKP